MFEIYQSEYEVEDDSTMITDPFFLDVYKQAFEETRRLEAIRELSEKTLSSATDSV